MFHSPQIVLFSHDVERLARFYKTLGFSETFRVPTDSVPIHIDIELDGYKLGIASVESTRDDHGLDPVESGQRAVVVLWTDDTEAAYRRLVDEGCSPLNPPHTWLESLSIAWVADPDDYPVQVVQHLTSG